MFPFHVRGLTLFWIIGTVTHASVHISNGTVHGIFDNESGVEKFLGIPFAEPPVGARRLRQAAPLEQSFGTIEADKFGPSCISARYQGLESEDCLTLNIWRPLSTSKSNVSFPVLVWLYGGSLTSGYTVVSKPASDALTLITDVHRTILATKPLL